MAKVSKKAAAQPLLPTWKYYLGWSIVSLIGMLSCLLIFKPSWLGLGEEKPSETAPSTQFDNNLSVLLLGYGGGEHAGGTLTDTILLANVNRDTKLISLISIPRDLWVTVPLASGARQTKINAAYSLGDGDVTKQLVADITTVQPDYYVAVDFATFVRTIDTIGPLEVDVPYTFDDYFYPIEGKEDDPCGFSEAEIATLTATLNDFDLEQKFICRYEHIHFDQGSTTMDGTTALKFVRSRHSGTGGGDFGRSERQQAFIQAVMKKVLSIGFVTKVVPLAQQLSAGVKTDFPISALPDLIGTLGNRDEYTTHSIVLNSEGTLVDAFSRDGQAILLPSSGEENWTSIQSFIQNSMLEATASGDLSVN